MLPCVGKYNKRSLQNSPIGPNIHLSFPLHYAYFMIVTLLTMNQLLLMGRFRLLSANLRPTSWLQHIVM